MKFIGTKPVYLRYIGLTPALPTKRGNHGNNATVQQRPNRYTEKCSKCAWLGIGLEFIVEDTADGIKLKPMIPYLEPKAEELLGCIGYKGPKKSLKEMEAAIAKGAAIELDGND